MSEFTSQARPYAQAAFEFALEQQDGLQKWSDGLLVLSHIAQNATVAQLLLNPKYTTRQAADVFIAIAGDHLNQAMQNFVKLLAHYGRLGVVSAIVTLYEEHRAAREQTIGVFVTSSIPLDEEYKRLLSQNLSKTLQRDATLQCKVDETLLGGIEIRTGDKVMDRSVKGQLIRLKKTLMG